MTTVTENSYSNQDWTLRLVASGKRGKTCVCKLTPNWLRKCEFFFFAFAPTTNRSCSELKPAHTTENPPYSNFRCVRSPNIVWQLNVYFRLKLAKDTPQPSGVKIWRQFWERQQKGKRTECSYLPTHRWEYLAKLSASSSKDLATWNETLPTRKISWMRIQPLFKNNCFKLDAN